MKNILAICAVLTVVSVQGDDLSEARRWFEDRTGEMTEKARRVRTDGRPAYAPQTSNHYKASWLGDFEFMLEADVVPREDVLDAAMAFFDGMSPEGDGVNCITYGGKPIYQLGYGTFGTNAICDGVPYTIDVMYLAWRKMRERSLVESRVLDRLVKAVARIPHDPKGNTDLVWIDPAHPWDRSAFGFHDTVRKQGDCFFESVLEWQAFGRLAEMLSAGGRGAEAETLRARQAKLAADIDRAFWDESASLYRAATVQCREHDVWGSAFAVWTGLAPAARADAVARRFRDDFGGLTRNGQVRHCLPGVYWEKSCKRDHYQNGGFWGTPVGWFAFALERVAPELVDRMYAELVADYKKRGVSEWTFGEKVAIPEGFLGSAVWPLAGLKRICAARAAKAKPVLRGDGVTDDTEAIQTMLDRRTSCVYLPPPKEFYLISRALELESGQTLRLDPGTRVKLAPKSDCHMLVNRNWRSGDRDIAVIGGIWDLDNANQSPNPHQGRHCKPPRKIALPKSFQRDFYRGEIFCFDRVDGLTVRDVTFRNPTTYSLQMTRTSYFVIDGVTFDFDSWNPIPLNMDGVHCDGGCHHGKISNLRGTCFDDLVALNANDGICAAYEGEIADIDIDGVYADYCHSAVRLLSAGADLKRVTIRNVHGNFYTYAVGLTHYFPEKPRGRFDDIVIADVFASKVFAPEGIGVNSRTNYPLVWVEGPVDVGQLTVRNFSRDERRIPVASIRVDKASTVEQLTVRDCTMVNRMETPIYFFDVRGKVDAVVTENNRFQGRWHRREAKRCVASAGPVMIKNEDNEHIFMGELPVTEKGLVEYVDFMTKGRALTHLFLCACGQRASFDSEAWEPIWYGFDEKDYTGKTNYVWKSNAKRFRDAGVDPYKVMIRRARDNGVSPWMSMRMNDIHFVTSDKLSRTTRFWRDHQELRIYPDLVAMGSRNQWTDFTLDFAHKEVRDYNFAMARELLTRYDCDGLELDWLRCSPCVTPETAQEDAHFITEFVRCVKKAADRAAADRGRPVGVAVRVPPTRKDRQLLGYELEKWVEEELVDIVVLSGESAAYFELDIGQETRALKAMNPSVVVVPAIDRLQCNDESFPMHGNLALYRGWADSMLSRGAEGLYLFNLEYSSREAQKNVYAGALAPENVTRGARRYISSCDDVANKICKPKTKSLLPLPVAKDGGMPVMAGRSKPEQTVEVVLGFDVADIPEGMKVTLNGIDAVATERQRDLGQYCGATRWMVRTLGAMRWRYPLSAFREGVNCIAFKAVPDSKARVVWAEVALDDPQNAK